MRTAGGGEMSVDDWEDEGGGGFSCGGAVIASKKLKKIDGTVEKQQQQQKQKQQQQQQQQQQQPPPRIPKSLLFIPPSRRPKVQKSQRLRPEKWKAAFDLEGRPVGFHKLLKIIRKGGVDHSIRAEVWEFLLGCYELGTTLAYRELVRQARRERYNELLEQCRKMHSSIGTGSLAYTVGSKLMDVRVSANHNNTRKEDSPTVETPSAKAQQSRSHSAAVTPREPHIDAIKENVNVNVKENANVNANENENENLNLIARELSKREGPETDVQQQEGTSSSDELIRLQEPLPGEVDSSETTNLQKKPGAGLVKKRTSIEAEAADSIQNIPTKAVSGNPSLEDFPLRDKDMEGQREDKERERAVPAKGGSNFIKSADLDSLRGPGLSGDAERVTDWLWTLHRIVVDVVRTDKHLEFYNEGKNSARMSDILAVYAWVDPATGYCQGMSDLLSPFLVLFDIDADAFWCFESLLKRVRDNFQMEGPVRVMKQLEAMPKILDVTDADMLKHLVLVGADNFLFAFRMLLVLFRRELSFPEALYMWEMMWAADFHQATAWSFEYHSLEALRLPNFSSPARVFPLEDEAPPSPESATAAAAAFTPPTSPERLHNSNNNNDNNSAICTSAGTAPSFDALRCRALAKRRSFCGLRPGRLWQFQRNRLRSGHVGMSGPDGDHDLSVFCVAAIIEQNRGMLLDKLQSMDDAIKIFNNMEMEFKVHSCVNNAVKLRNRYRNQSSKRVPSERRSISRQPWSL